MRYASSLMYDSQFTFVQKRRSGRKKAEKKSYDEEKPMDFEEEVEELPNGDAEPIPEKKANEWVVERILGVRIVPKKVRNKVTFMYAKHLTGQEKEVLGQHNEGGRCEWRS